MATVPETPASEDVLAVAEHLCGRATTSGDQVPARHHGEVALELREMLPLVDDATFDEHMARIDVIAGHITALEVDEAGTEAHEAAALAAGLDPFDFPLRRPSRMSVEDEDLVAAEEFRSAVIEHWDLELRREVASLVAANNDPAQWRDDGYGASGVHPRRRTA